MRTSRPLRPTRSTGCRRILMAVAVVGLLSSCSDDSAQTTDENTVSAQENVVTVVPASRLLYTPERSAPAESVALNQSRIPARIASVVNEIAVRVGDQVEQGELLAVLDCREYRQMAIAESARVDELAARLAYDQRELERGEGLARKNSISEAVVDQRVTTERSTRAQLTAQQAALERARLNVTHCEVTAPFSGVVLDRLTHVGEMVAVGSDLFELLEVDQQEIIARVSLTDIQSFEQAGSYRMTRGDWSVELILRKVLPLVDENSQSRRAVLTVRDPEAVSELVSGVTGRIVWTSPEPHLPAQLLQWRDGQTGVFVIDRSASQAVARFVPVASAEEGRPIPISLNPDQAVALQGRHGLIDGQPVAATEDQTEQQP